MTRATIDVLRYTVFRRTHIFRNDTGLLNPINLPKYAIFFFHDSPVVYLGHDGMFHPVAVLVFLPVSYRERGLKLPNWGTSEKKGLHTLL